MITNIKNILFVYLFVGVVSIVAMQKEYDDQGVERFKGIIRELSCTCINNKNFPPELSEGSKNAETIMKILNICNKDIRSKKKGLKVLKKVKEIILSKYCRCMNNEEGVFDIGKVPFKISPTNRNGFRALMELKKIMKKSLGSIHKIVDQFRINPNIIMLSLESHDHYTTIFGYFISLFLDHKIYIFINKELSKKYKIKEKKSLYLVKKFLKNGGDPDKIEYPSSNFFTSLSTMHINSLKKRYIRGDEREYFLLYDLNPSHVDYSGVCYVRKRHCLTSQEVFDNYFRNNGIIRDPEYYGLSDNFRTAQIELKSGINKLFNEYRKSRKNQK